MVRPCVVVSQVEPPEKTKLTRPGALFIASYDPQELERYIKDSSTRADFSFFLFCFYKNEFRQKILL
jgi:hypothetical protein